MGVDSIARDGFVAGYHIEASYPGPDGQSWPFVIPLAALWFHFAWRLGHGRDARSAWSTCSN